MEWEYIKKYLEQEGLKDPQFSEPKWFASTGADQTLEFPSVKYIYLLTLLTPIVDGGAAGTDFTFSVNSIVLFRFATGVGLQADSKCIPVNYMIPTQRAVLSLNDGTLNDWSVQLIIISEKCH